MTPHRDLRKRINRLQGTPNGAIRDRISAAVLAASLAVPTLGLSATPQHPHEEIRRAARTFLDRQPPTEAGRMETEVGRLDPRLRLAQCGEPLSVSRPPGSRAVGRTTLEIRCSAPKRWKLLLPVNVRVFDKVVAAARTLARGTVLRKDDLVLRERELSRLGYGYIRDLEDAVGMELRRAARSGATLTPNQLAAQRLVRRGQRVTIIAMSGGIEVRMLGEALADGARDERIRVRNRKTKRVVEGIVESSGVVRVNL